MRFFLVLFILAAVGAGAYYSDADVREKVRGFQVSDAEREQFDAYKEGKALFKTSWKDASHGEFKAWGDGSAETATAVSGRSGIWLARGTVTVDSSGTKSDETWCIAIDHTKGQALGRGLVGAEATEALQKFDSPPAPQRTVAAPPAPAPAAIPGRPTPAAPGSWMWSKDGRSALDQPPTKSKH